MLCAAVLCTVSTTVAGFFPGDPTPARYVRISLPGEARVLSLAEVEVFVDGEAIQTRGLATQSSVASGGEPQRAIDGNTSGNWEEGSVTHTKSERDPWWEVDLGGELLIDRLVVWNRTDCCGERLQGFIIEVLDGKREMLWRRERVPQPYGFLEVLPFTAAPPSDEYPTVEQRRALQPGINAAIERGVAYLLQHQLWDGSFALHSSEYPAGMTALALYTFLKCKVPHDEPSVRRAVSYLLAHPPTQTYEIGITLMAFGALGEPEYSDYMETLVDRLLGMQGTPSADGKIDELFPYPRTAATADLSLAQYAALGLRAAQKSGIRVADRVWKGIALGVLRHQEEPYVIKRPSTDRSGRPEREEIAGFPYRYGGKCTGSMTTAGLGILTICRQQMSDVPLGLERRLEKASELAVSWLVQRFSVEGNVDGPGRWLFYYLYGLERVGSLLQKARFGEHDWYYEGARFLVGKQEGNGSWTPEEQANTCFALLFLTRATGQPDSGPGKGEKGTRDLWVSEAAEDDVHWRITGTRPATLFVSGFSAAAIERLGMGEGSARGLHVQSVEFLLNGEVIDTIAGDPGRKWGGERFATRCDFTAPGSYRCEVRVRVKAPSADGKITTTVILAGAPLVVEIEGPEGRALVELPRQTTENLLVGTRAEVTASTENHPGQRAAFAADGRLATKWLTQKDDPEPFLSIKLERPQRGNVLRIVQANVNEDQRNGHDRAARVRVVINRKKSLTFELNAPERDEELIELVLDRTVTLRLLEITILDRVPGQKWPGHAGVSEVLWLDRR